MEIVGGLLLTLFLIWLASHGRRLRNIEDSLPQRLSESEREQIVDLTRRVYALERQIRERPAAAPAATPVAAQGPPAPPPRVVAPIVAAPPQIAIPVPPPLPPPVVAPPPVVVSPPTPVPQSAPVATPPSPPPAPKPARPVAPPPPPPAFAPVTGPTLGERLFAGEEWEAVVGGSWLNKLGGVVLVVGLALLLGYSAARVGPLGRVLISLGASLSLLVTGVIIEARGRFRVFARGLIGAGWAGLYATAYAMHSVAAARVIQDPWTGAALLLAVAAGMIVHSLRYRSEAVTGVAYAAAYVSLAITPLAPFSVLGLFPITASLLILCSKMRWHTAALLSLAATYAVCGTRESHGTPLWATTALIGGYWLAFEIYDLVRSAEREEAPWQARAIWPLNGAAAFLLAYAKWLAVEPKSIHWLLAGAGAAYLLSAIARAMVRPPSSFAEGDVRFDGYEPAATVAAGLIAWACLEGFSLLHAVFALAAEAEALFAAGLIFRAAHLRRLAAAVFGAAAIALGADASRGEPKAATGLLRYPWTPAASLLAGLFYLNRALRRPGLAYSWMASAAVMIVLGFEVPLQYLGLAWLALAALLFEFGFLRRLDEFRLQSYICGATSVLPLVLVNVTGAGLVALPNAWRWLYIAIAAFYALTGQMLRSWSGRLEEDERKGVRAFCSWAGSLASAAVLWHAVRLEDLGLAWLLLAAVLFEVGVLVRLNQLRWQAYTIGLTATASLAVFNAYGGGLPDFGIAALPNAWRWLYFAIAVFFAITGQLLRAWPGRLGEGEGKAVRAFCSWAGSLAAAALLWHAVRLEILGLAWLLLAAVLFEAGLLVRLNHLRRQAYTIGLAGAGCLALFNVYGAGQMDLGFSIPPSAWRVLYYAIAVFYALTSQLLRPWPGRLSDDEREMMRAVCSWAGSLASAALLWHAVPLENLGLAWLLLGAALFEVALLVRLDDLRWQGYTLGFAAAGCLAAINGFGAGLPGPDGQWQRLAVAAGVYFALAVQTARWWPASVESASERAGVRSFSATAGAAAAAAAIWFALPSPLIALGWGALALALFEAGALGPSFRSCSAVLAGMTFARLFFANFSNLGATAGVSHRILTVGPVIALFYYLWARLRTPANRLLVWESGLARLYLYAPAILWTVLLRFEMGRTLAVTGWALTGVALLAIGWTAEIADLRAQSYALAVLTFVRCWNINFYIAESLLGAPARVLTGAFVIASFYAGEFLSPRRKAEDDGVRSWLARIDAQARVGFSLMATTLLALLIFYEVSGTLRTVGWGIEGAALLLAGFGLRERSLRLAGLALLLACAAKLFVYDLRELEIVYRILSFIVLGLLLLGASWIYTRYRDELKRYL
jgi:hypothetical protein